MSLYSPFELLDSPFELLVSPFELLVSPFEILVSPFEIGSFSIHYMQMRNEKVTILALSKGETRKSDDTRAINGTLTRNPFYLVVANPEKNIHHSTALDELNPKMYFIFAKWQFRDFRKPIDFATQDSTFRFEMTWTGMRNVVE